MATDGDVIRAREEDLTAALDAAAETIRPQALRPLIVPGQPGRLSVPHVGGTPRWRRLAPLGAAMAVVVIVALALASVQVRPGPRHAAVPGSVAPHVAAPGSVPPYYVALNVTGNGDCCRAGLPYSPVTTAVVRATATGATLATVTPPRPYGTFIGVTAAADDRTFVLAAVQLTPLPYTQAPPAGLFLLRIDPASPAPAARARLSPLPITVQPPGTGVTGLALSPDGGKLAIAEVYPIAAPPALHVVTLATGAQRVWAATIGGPTSGPGTTGEPLSWAQDERTLAFVLAGTQVRLLNTAAASSSLLTSSRLVVSAPEGDLAPYWQQVMITGDGQTILAVIEIVAEGKNGHGSSVRQELVTFSARTGKLLHVLNQIPVYGNYQYEQVLWASPTGQVLIVSGTQPGTTVSSVGTGATAVVLSHGHLTPIPWSNRTFAAAW